MRQSAFGLIVSTASVAQADTPVGTWSTANGHGVVAVEQRGGALCGRIVSVDRALTEPMSADVNGRLQCGLTILTNEMPAADGTWLGQITDPRDGSTYQAKLGWMKVRLHLRGFISSATLCSDPRKYGANIQDC